MSLFLIGVALLRGVDSPFSFFPPFVACSRRCCFDLASSMTYLGELCVLLELPLLASTGWVRVGGCCIVDAVVVAALGSVVGSWC